MDSIIPQKRCTACEEELPATTEYFHPDKRVKSGLRSVCKICRCAAEVAYAQKRNADPVKFQEYQQYQKQYNLLHKEDIQQLQRNWYEAHQEEVKQRTKRRYWADPEASRLYHRQYSETHREEKIAYYEKNRERFLQWGRQYCRTHTKEFQARNQKRRAMVKSIGGVHTAQDIQKQFASQKGKCYYCHRKLQKYHVDHIIPITRGGSNNPENLVVTCPTCNMKKHNKLPHEWPEGGRLL